MSHEMLYPHQEDFVLISCFELGIKLECKQKKCVSIGQMSERVAFHVYQCLFCYVDTFPNASALTVIRYCVKGKWQ